MKTDELKLLDKAHKGNEQSISLLFNAYNKTAFNISYRILHRADLAEDIVIDCFMKLIQNDFHIDTSLSAYFYRSVVNASLNELKKTQRESVSYNEFNYDKVDGETPEEITEKKLIINKIKQAISELPENQRIAFTLIKYENMSYKEAGEIMHTTVKSLEGLVARAKATLKEKLKDLYEN